MSNYSIVLFRVWIIYNYNYDINCNLWWTSSCNSFGWGGGFWLAEASCCVYCHNLTWTQPHTLNPWYGNAAHLHAQVFHFITVTVFIPARRLLPFLQAARQPPDKTPVSGLRWWGQRVTVTFNPIKTTTKTTNQLNVSGGEAPWRFLVQSALIAAL